MKVLVGNPVRPEAVTTIIVPDDFDAAARFRNAVGCLQIHLRDGDIPTWIESDDKTLQAQLEAHYAKDSL